MVRVYVSFGCVIFVYKFSVFLLMYSFDVGVVIVCMCYINENFRCVYFVVRVCCCYNTSCVNVTVLNCFSYCF